MDVTFPELLELRPTKVHFSQSMGVFGMSMSDGSRVQGGAYKCDLTRTLPNLLRKIEVIFRQQENQLHSIIFHGKDTSLHVGWTDDRIERSRLPASFKSNRVESLQL